MNPSKNILITGASTGIGYDLCKAFVASDYQVFGSVRKSADAERLQAELGENFHSLIFDVTDHVAVDKAVGELEKQIPEGLGGLINNAGIAIGGPFAHIPIEDFRYQFEVNVIGLIKVTQAFLPLLGAREDHLSAPGRIVQISSVAGKLGMPFISPYIGSKHAVEGISQSLRRELMLYGIEVIVVGPGAVKTPIWNKSADEETMGKYLKTPFGEALSIFQGVFVKDSIKNGFDSDKLANDVLRIFEKKRPKTRYALVAQKFKNWTLPRMLSDRALDNFVGKNLKLKK